MSYRHSPAWMWADALKMLERAERLQRQFFRLGATVTQQSVWEPPADVVETVDEVRIVVALPGISPERLEVGFEGDSIKVDAERPLRLPAEQNVIHRLEIPYGRFTRRIALPPGRYELKEQSMSNGCLHVRLKKHP